MKYEDYCDVVKTTSHKKSRKRRREWYRALYTGTARNRLNFVQTNPSAPGDIQWLTAREREGILVRDHGRLMLVGAPMWQRHYRVIGEELRRWSRDEREPGAEGAAELYDLLVELVRGLGVVR